MPGRARVGRAPLLSMMAAGVIAIASACGDEGPEAAKQATATPAAIGVTAVPGAGERVTLAGTLTLDGTPLEAEFLGVRVVRDGLPAACQATIPAVTRGRYEIKVVSDAEGRGCGAPGAEIMLWAFANDGFIFGSHTLPWPGNGATATWDTSFSSGAPEGAGTPVTEFKGHLLDREGSELPSGTVIEAFAGDTLCGVTSLRHGNDVERYYTLIVAGPESVAACEQGARLTFRLDGEPAAETAVNDLGSGSEGHELDLTLQ